MKRERFEVIRRKLQCVSGFREGQPRPQAVQGDPATGIIKALDRDGLSVRKAQALTGIAAADFSRIRNADLGRFTVDRLMSIINRLGSPVEVAVKVKRSTAVGHVPAV
jgi:hypothetical protein